MTSLFGSQENQSPVGSDKKNPTWLQNPSRRVIPNHLVPKKRLAFQLSGTSNNKKDEDHNSKGSHSSNSNTFNSNDFNLISFGNAGHGNRGSASHADASSLFLTADNQDTSQSFDNDDIPFYNDNDDLPPARSLYDLNDEVIISLNKPQQHTESFINKDPKSFVNAFHQRDNVLNTKKEESVANSGPLLHNESAILVFGYPEAIASEIIAYFSEFGTILEQFQASKRLKNANSNILSSFAAAGAFHNPGKIEEPGNSLSSQNLPIFGGNSWVKLTYDNPSSAQDALRESGSVFNGVLIGVVPYTKDAIEKLQKRKLTPSEDIGGGFLQFTHQETDHIDKAATGDSNDTQASYIKRLDVKDGTGLFLRANGTSAQGQSQDQKKDEKLGLLGSVTKYFFGFHDL